MVEGALPSRVAIARLLRRSPGSAAKAALNDCPHERKAKGAHLAAFVSCIPLFDRPALFPDLWNTETSANFLGQIVWNLCVPWNRLALAVCRTGP